MAILKKCCYFYSLRTGSLLSAYITLIYFVLEAATRIYYLIWWNRSPGRTRNQSTSNTRIFNIAWGLELGLSVIMIFASLLLINGILKNSIVQMLGTGIANLIMCFILIYCLLCVMSYYRDIDQADIP
ncbi:uncharacterized protein LOC135926635 isoform X2 [Gordionus sp. m RMFG-2023]|uniref:uncharacterized protein LOC135926635 isoform X2 n=1 Tax=Gordionus sp. m RMFG-2023 TaxID=3053472 RepID=UPI0031FBE377